MGMLLRRRKGHEEDKVTVNTTHVEKKVEKVTESVKDEKPKTIKRGRPSKT
jgi:hypothetical protein